MGLRGEKRKPRKKEPTSKKKKEEFGSFNVIEGKGIKDFWKEVANRSDWGTQMKEKGVLGTSTCHTGRCRGPMWGCEAPTASPQLRPREPAGTGSRPPLWAFAKTGKGLEVCGCVDDEGETPLSMGDKCQGWVFSFLKPSLQSIET